MENEMLEDIRDTLHRINGQVTSELETLRLLLACIRNRESRNDIAVLDFEKLLASISTDIAEIKVVADDIWNRIHTKGTP